MSNDQVSHGPSYEAGAGPDGDAATPDVAVSGEQAGAATVAAELGHAPLALTLAKAMIVEQHLGHQEYLDRLRALRAGKCVISGPEQYPQWTAEAVMLSVQAVGEQDQTGVCGRVLEVMAVLSPAGVPRDLLYSGELAGVQRAGAAVVDRAVDRLAAWSLMTVNMDRQTVIVHYLVIRAVRDGLVQRGRLALVCRAVGLVLEARARALAASPDRQGARDISRQVAALVEAAAEQADDDLAAALLGLRFLGLYHLIELGDSGQAISVGEPLVADFSRLLGPGHPDTLNAQNSLAAAYQEAGRADEAIPLFERTLAGRRRTLGPSHPYTLNSQHNLAAAYQDAGRTAEAIQLFERTLAVREGVLGFGHPSTLNSCGNLAAAYRDAGQPAEAIPLLERTLIGREQVLGPGHPDTVTTRKNLDRARRDVGQAAETIAPPEPASATRDSGPVVAERQVAPQSAISAPVTDHGPAADPEPVTVRMPAADPEPVTVRLPTTDAELEGGGEPEPAAEAEDGGEPAAAQHPKPIVPGLEQPVISGPPPSGRPSFPRRMRVPIIVAVVLILLAAAGVTLALSGYPGSGHRINRGGAPRSDAVGNGHKGVTAADPMQMAAAWVGQQISGSTIVICDPVTCSALKARGIPAAELLIMRPSTASPLGAQVVVATPAVRSQFGSRLASEYAPAVIAGFGAGPGQVEVRVVAPGGAAPYMAALRQDLAARTSAGVQLLANKRIQVAARARIQLAAGEVDSRLLLMLPIMAAVHPIDILAFGDPGPEASPGVPLCSADLSGSGTAAAMTDASYLRWVAGFLRAQTSLFAARVVVQLQAGQPVVQAEFSRPSPLGLLGDG